MNTSLEMVNPTTISVAVAAIAVLGAAVFLFQNNIVQSFKSTRENWFRTEAPQIRPTDVILVLPMPDTPTQEVSSDDSSGNDADDEGSTDATNGGSVSVTGETVEATEETVEATEETVEATEETVEATEETVEATEETVAETTEEISDKEVVVVRKRRPYRRHRSRSRGRGRTTTK